MKKKQSLEEEALGGEELSFWDKYEYAMDK